jgi:hypothetical protein
MKHVFIAASALALVTALGACKQDAATDTATTSETAQGTGIDGTWVIDLASVKFAGKPVDLLLKDGKYSCNSCVPQVTVAADGTFHAVAGLDYADEFSVKVDSPTQDTTAVRKGGAAVGTTVFTVSADGKTLTRNFTDTSIKGAKPVTGTSTLERIGEAPAGAHALSGKWNRGKFENYSEEALTSTDASPADSLKMTGADGTSFDAKLDGSETPITGDPAGATVSVTKTGDNTWHTVTKIKGKEVGSSDMTLDGGVLHITSIDTATGNKTSYDAKRK